MKPVIGITSTRHTTQTNLPGLPLTGNILSDDYVHGIEEAGGLPFVIAHLNSEDTILRMAERIDGLLLSGGQDVNPGTYGAEPRLGLGAVTPERDTLEIKLLQAVRAQGKPVLGICRGMQVINVALGGTLYQDLPREWKGQLQHVQQAPRGHLSHTVQIKPGSQVYNLLGRQPQMKVNSFHHQAVKEIAPDLAPVAWDEEGLVEAVESTSDPFLVAVQWHPENLWREHRQFLGLFRGLVDAAVIALVK